MSRHGGKHSRAARPRAHVLRPSAVVVPTSILGLLALLAVLTALAVPRPTAATAALPIPPLFPSSSPNPTPSPTRTPSPSESPGPEGSPTPAPAASPTTATTPTTSAPLLPGFVTLTLPSGRRGYVQVPPEGAEGRPVLLLLHAWRNGPADVLRQSWLAPLSRSAGVVLVVGETDGPAWSAGSCCAGVADPESDRDVTYAAQLLTAVRERWGTDGTRVAATGMSNGGMMAWRLACQAPWLVPSGIVSVAGPLTIDAGTCPVSIPVLQVHGIFDVTVDRRGGRSNYTLTTFVSSALQIARVLQAQRERRGGDAILADPHPRLLLWFGAHSWPAGGRGSLPDPGRLALGLLSVPGGRAPAPDPVALAPVAPGREF